ncbi:hypothetical protein EB796_006847 [Bugula neritina]|uniref:Steroid 21-hydroxylase n=1 Tax=Bugula neritina TaxID=10212 RepID=A0A7J7K9C4_BUGNE|nr:hypothetical protein EB796_006847 [Bugula neritina]
MFCHMLKTGFCVHAVIADVTIQDPLRKIPGPRGLPFIGNTLSVDPTKLHMILYDWAEKYGDIMKISLFNTPMVVVNSTELAYDVLVKTGTDFQGRPPVPRADRVMGNNLGFRSINDPGYQQKRHYATKAIKGYTFDDPVCQSISKMTREVLNAQSFFLKETQKQIQQARNYVDEILYKKIAEYKAEFDENCLKGILDQLILIQKQEVGTDDPVMDDSAIHGIMLDFVVGGMETSQSDLCQALLDFLHEPDLQKRLQDEIDSQFEPSHIITLKDRPKLPSLQAYIYENLRYKTVIPTLVPHKTIRDTKIAEYVSLRGH